MLTVESKETKAPVAETKSNLDKYLAGAVAVMGGKTKSDAKQAFAQYDEKADKSGIGLDEINMRQDALKKEAAGYGVRTKLNYITDADVAGISNVVSFGVAGVATSMLAPIAAADPSVLSATMAVAGVAYTVTKGAKAIGAELSVSVTPKQKRSAEEYADVKHALLALKQLKKAVEAPIKAAERAKDKELISRCFAAGMGNPGGMISTFKGRDR